MPDHEPPIPNAARHKWCFVIALLVALAMMAGLATPAAAGSKKNETDEPVAVVVKLEAWYRIESVAADHGAIEVVPIVPSRGLYSLYPGPGKKKAKDRAKDLAKQLSKDRRVQWAEVDREDARPETDYFHAWPSGEATALGLDPGQWRDQPALDHLRLDEVHRISTGRGVVVAVLDTGVDLDHPQLIDGLIDGYDYVDDDHQPDDEGNGLDDDGDGLVDESHGHGTHTAGLVHLVAPDAKIMPMRVLDSDGTGNGYVVAEAIRDAIDADADVISLSFGMSRRSKSKALKQAMRQAAKAGIPIIAAAGNRGDDSEQYPANEKEVIGVGATDDDDELADFSSHGKHAMVAAPGVNIISSTPGGGFARWSGTSMATPIVAGQVALVRSNDPDRELKKVIESSGKSSRKLRGKRKIDKGLIDIWRSLDD